jgi:DNA-binding NtrC family response regulator
MQEELPMVRVLLYSPEHELTALLSSALRPECSVIVEPDRRKLKETATAGNADVLVLDLDSKHAPMAEQLAFYDSVSDSPIPVVVMSDLGRSTITGFLQRGAFDCIRKPPSLIEFRVIVRRAYQHALMKQELERARQALSPGRGCDRLVGASGGAQVVYDLIRRVANLNAFVLITGESGTGKELVASAIHNLGNRAKHPFIAVSCGAIPETLIEAELFGHEKGAYTGSIGARAGLLEQAGEGTVFLDEIGELSLNTQVKLLRVLQEREFTRLGSNRRVPLNARVLFATHRPLAQMVEEGTFRRDLYFRVNVMTVNVPALRERAEDIPLLARYFLKKYADEYGKPVTDIRPNAIELLAEYDWPGNIRELENVIQGAVILTDGDTICRSDLPQHIQQLAEDDVQQPFYDEPPGFEDLLRQYKVKLITRAISDCNGNKSLAARKLKVSRAYLHRLVRMQPGAESHSAALRAC